MTQNDNNHTLLHREGVPGRYAVEMYRRDSPTGFICSWRHDYIVDVMEGDEGRIVYQFVSVREDEAEIHFLLECDRMARKWRPR